jgi:hypothetical protein
MYFSAILPWLYGTRFRSLNGSPSKSTGMPPPFTPKLYRSPSDALAAIRAPTGGVSSSSRRTFRSPQEGVAWLQRIPTPEAHSLSKPSRKGHSKAYPRNARRRNIELRVSFQPSRLCSVCYRYQRPLPWLQRRLVPVTTISTSRLPQRERRVELAARGDRRFSIMLTRASRVATPNLAPPPLRPLSLRARAPSPTGASSFYDCASAL